MELSSSVVVRQDFPSFSNRRFSKEGLLRGCLIHFRPYNKQNRVCSISLMHKVPCMNIPKWLDSALWWHHTIYRMSGKFLPVFH